MDRFAGYYRVTGNTQMKRLVILCAVILLLGCDDSPPDPNMPVVVDDTLNITQLTELISTAPAAIDETVYYRMKGSWESFAALDDPLGKLYAAIAPLGRFTAKTIRLDFSLVTGRNIADGTYAAASSRSYKGVLAGVKFPDDMQTIGAYAFYECVNLSELTFAGAAPPAIAPTAFTDIHNPVQVWIPEGAAANYAAFTTTIPGVIVQ
ncbi:hypothetical protein AGMMS49942_03080 [Spirochaetia bacterium]|nr:hypothetical protein AGMMS49942_03080 [Spirochaetia bacterium]